MAIKMNKGAAMLFNIVLMLSLLLIISMAEGRLLDLDILGKPKTASCDEVVGVQSNDTCFDIAQNSNLNANAFNSINPGINCTGLFIGQWICISGSLV